MMIPIIGFEYKPNSDIYLPFAEVNAERSAALGRKQRSDGKYETRITKFETNIKF
jgi:hypothetical protein